MMLVTLNRSLAKIPSSPADDIQMWCVLRRQIELPIPPFPGLWLDLENGDLDNRVEEVKWDADSHSLIAVIGSDEVHADALYKTIEHMEKEGWEVEEFFERPPPKDGNGMAPHE